MTALFSTQAIYIYKQHSLSLRIICCPSPSSACVPGARGRGADRPRAHAAAHGAALAAARRFPGPLPLPPLPVLYNGGWHNWVSGTAWSPLPRYGQIVGHADTAVTPQQHHNYTQSMYARVHLAPSKPCKHTARSQGVSRAVLFIKQRGKKKKNKKSQTWWLYANACQNNGLINVCKMFPIWLLIYVIGNLINSHYVWIT